MLLGTSPLDIYFVFFSLYCQYLYFIAMHVAMGLLNSNPPSS